jgi:phytoene synthase
MSEDRCYLAVTELNSYQYSIQDFSSALYNSNFKELMKFQVNRARQFFVSGSSLFPLIDPDSRICLVILSKIYNKILNKIENSNYNIFFSNYKLTRFEKLSIMGSTWLKYKITPN